MTPEEFRRQMFGCPVETPRPPSLFFIRVMIILTIVILFFNMPARIWNNMRKFIGLTGYETFVGGGWWSIGVSLIFWVAFIGIIIKWNS